MDGDISMADLRIAFIDNSVMDSVANKLKAYLEGVLPADLLDRLYITSAHRGNSNVDYHEDTGVNGALDIAGPMTDQGQRDMQTASRIITNDHALLLELIHTTPYDDDNGFYVKNGAFISSYGAATDAAHLNHIHLATSEDMGSQLMANHPKVGTSPVPVDDRTPVDTTATLFGYDGSDFTSVMNFAGLSFVTHKATEQAPGQIFDHMKFAPVMTAARDQGVPFLGAYVVPRTGPDVGAQVDTAIAFVRAQTPWLMDHPGFFWQVDLEHWGDYDNVAPSIGYEMARQLKAKTGKPAVVYAPKWAYGDTLPSGFPLWSSDYAQSGASRPFRDMYAGNNGSGWNAYSGQVPTLWQYASDARFADGNIGDINAFRGDEADFRRVVLGQTSTPAPMPNPDSAALDDDMRLDEIIVLRNMANNWDPNRAEFKAGGAGESDMAAWDRLTGGDPNKRINGVKQELDDIRDAVTALKATLAEIKALVAQ